MKSFIVGGQRRGNAGRAFPPPTLLMVLWLYFVGSMLCEILKNGTRCAYCTFDEINISEYHLCQGLNFA